MPASAKPSLRVIQSTEWSVSLLAFETLLLELSSRLATVPHERIESETEAALQRLAQFVGFDQSWIGEFAQSDAELHVLCSASSKVDGARAPTGVISSQVPWCAHELREGRTLAFPSIPDGLPPEADVERGYWSQLGLRSTLVIPINVGGRIVGSISFGAEQPTSGWPAELVAGLKAAGEMFLQTLMRSRSEVKLMSALAEIEMLRERTREENIFLRHAAGVRAPLDQLMSHSPRFRVVLEEVKQVASTHSTVLLIGETGTGKELLAHAIHNLSPRRERPMVTVNCAALPSTLIEAELFGREKGAYTGALTRQMGRFELADGSTLFLDEIGELPLELQTKLLRVLQQGEFERVGGTRTLKADVRVIAATNRDLAEAVNEGTFRADLYYRLNVFPIEVPPLRERREDVLMLTWSFIKDFNHSMGRHIESIDDSSVEALQRYSWPGNVRELRNTIERAMILAHEKTLRVTLGRTAGASRTALASLSESQRTHIVKTLEACRWRIRGPDGAAAVLNVKPTTLESRMKRLGIARPT